MPIPSIPQFETLALYASRFQPGAIHKRWMFFWNKFSKRSGTPRTADGILHDEIDFAYFCELDDNRPGSSATVEIHEHPYAYELVRRAALDVYKHNATLAQAQEFTPEGQFTCHTSRA